MRIWHLNEAAKKLFSYSYLPLLSDHIIASILLTVHKSRSKGLFLYKCRIWTIYFSQTISLLNPRSPGLSYPRWDWNFFSIGACGELCMAIDGRRDPSEYWRQVGATLPLSCNGSSKFPF